MTSPSDFYSGMAEAQRGFLAQKAVADTAVNNFKKLEEQLASVILRQDIPEYQDGTRHHYVVTLDAHIDKLQESLTRSRDFNQNLLSDKQDRDDLIEQLNKIPVWMKWFCGVTTDYDKKKVESMEDSKS